MKSTSLQTAEPVLSQLQRLVCPLVPSGIEIPSGRFVQFLKKRGWIILVATVLGATTAIFVNFISTRLYTASAQVEIVPDRSGEPSRRRFRVSTRVTTQKS